MSKRVIPNVNEVQDIKDSYVLGMCGGELEMSVVLHAERPRLYRGKGPAPSEATSLSSQQGSRKDRRCNGKAYRILNASHRKSELAAVHVDWR